jgi:CO/xanthine dehydrogenase Mo-binding subunit
MLDAVERVMGRVAYAANLKLPGMLVAKVLRSQVPHANLKRVDGRAAENLPGVVAVLTGSDFDAPGQPYLHYGAFLKDQPVVARERVRFIGEPLALVAAETSEATVQALESIEVEYEELPGVYDALAAFRPSAPELHKSFPGNCFVHAKLRHGDLEAGFAAAAEIIEETYTSPVAQHSSLEAHTCAAQWVGGKLTVWTASQAPYTVRKVLSEIFRLAPEDIRVIVPPVGGGYGGKGHVRIEPMVAALAWKANGRPVKLGLTRAEEFFTVTKHAATITIKSGVTRMGG